MNTLNTLDTKKYIIAVDIRTTARLHISAIEKGAYDPATRRLSRYDGNGIGCSLTRTLALADGVRVTESGAVFVPQVPVIPASTVAGKLRRAAADLVNYSLIKRGLSISPDAYNVMCTGMASTELKADDATPETRRTARRDPFLSLFGGTSFAMSAGSVIAEGLPLVPMTRAILMSEPIDAVQPFTDMREMTEVVAIVRKNDVASLNGKFLEGVVGFDALVQYIQSESDSRGVSKAKKAAGGEGKKTDLRALNAFEAVSTGVGFALRVEVTSRTPAHLGLMLLAMQSFLRDGQVGGKGARGLGRFIATASRLYELDPANRQTTVLSSLFEDKASGYAFCDDETVDAAATAAQDYVDSVSPLLIEAFTKADAKKIKALYREAA